MSRLRAPTLDKATTRRVEHLTRVERMEPQVLRYNQQAQQLIVDLLHRGRRSAAPALRGLARYAAPVVA